MLNKQEGEVETMWSSVRRGHNYHFMGIVSAARSAGWGLVTTISNHLTSKVAIDLLTVVGCYESVYVCLGSRNRHGNYNPPSASTSAMFLSS